MRQIFQGYYGLYFLLLYCLALQKAITKFIINLYSVYYKTIKFKKPLHFYCYFIAKDIAISLLFIRNEREEIASFLAMTRLLVLLVN